MMDEIENDGPKRDVRGCKDSKSEIITSLEAEIEELHNMWARVDYQSDRRKALAEHAFGQLSNWHFVWMVYAQMKS